eukprot:COSAG06_NODE_10206_length_1726_cov_16.429010_1_plen_20_part_10
MNDDEWRMNEQRRTDRVILC